MMLPATTTFFFLFLVSTVSPAKGNFSFPALLVFGDSTVDTGNNNHITTFFRSNHRPYGRDLPGSSPSGRFSNGLLVPDILATELGIGDGMSRPFMDPALSDSELRHGANFASAGAGFDELTTSVTGVIPVARQAGMMEEYLRRLEAAMGKEGAARVVEGALVMISAGTNDMVLDYYDVPMRRLQFNMGDYQDFILQKLEGIIKDIYNLGGRKFMVTGLGPMGCVPIQMTAKFKSLKQRTCVEEENTDTAIYNAKLKGRLAELKTSLPGAKLAYADVFDSILQVITDPHTYGFDETKKGCCGTGYTEMGHLCNILSPTCPDASKYIFFDAIHPTEHVYRIIVKNLMVNIIPQLY